MAVIIDGKELSKKILDKIKIEVEELKNKGIIPKLAMIMVGDDEASKIYIKNKSKACINVGVEFEEFILDKNINQEELIELVKKLNNRSDIHGILVQSPLPKQIDEFEIYKTIDYRKDIDGFNPTNVGRLQLNKNTFLPCTAHAIVRILEEYNIDIQGKHTVIIGRSNIVGKPLAQCLLNKDATVTICHSKTENLKQITNTADILISAVGNPKFITEDMVKENAVVIDVGINRVNGLICGDVDFENVKDKASYITPVPGGVGPMTVAMLLKNVVIAALYLNK